MKGFWYTIIAALCSSLMIALGKEKVDSVDPLVFVFYMAFFASCSGLFLLPFSKPVNDKAPLDRSILTAFVGHTLSVYLALWAIWVGIRYTTPVVAAFLSNTQVFFTILLSWIFLSEKLRPSMLFSALFIVTGSIVLKSHGSHDSISDSFWGWAALTGAAMAFAVGDIFVKSVAKKVSMIRFLFIRNITLTLLYGVSMVSLKNNCMILSTESLKTIFIVAVLGMVLARLFFNIGLKHWQVSKAIVAFQVHPLFAALWTYVLLHDSPSLIQWFGGGLIISGIVILQWREVFFCYGTKRTRTI